MGVTEILSSIDREIAILKQARALLSGDSAPEAKNDGVYSAFAADPATKRKKRNLSPEGRRRIAEAVKRRWEKHRKAAAAK